MSEIGAARYNARISALAKYENIITNNRELIDAPFTLNVGAFGTAGSGKSAISNLLNYTLTHDTEGFYPLPAAPVEGHGTITLSQLDLLLVNDPATRRLRPRIRLNDLKGVKRITADHTHSPREILKRLSFGIYPRDWLALYSRTVVVEKPLDAVIFVVSAKPETGPDQELTTHADWTFIIGVIDDYRTNGKLFFFHFLLLFFFCCSFVVSLS